jgi:choline dehydrogenase-like flavoprotein
VEAGVTHLSFRTGPDLTLDADFVVVGSGAGGATLAHTLARAGASVILVESGAWRDPEHLPAGFYGAVRDVFDAWQTTLTTGPALWPVVQASAVGGTTVINSAICVRTPPDVIEDWARNYGVDGPRLARDLERHQGDLEQDIGVEAVFHEAGETDRLAERGARALGGHDHVMHRYTRGCEGSGRCTLGCRAGRKRSLDQVFLPEVLRKNGVILSCAPAHHVLTNGTRAIGVEGWFRHPVSRKRGARYRVLARRGVALAASPVHTPGLLQRSGLRHRAIGAGFRAHPGLGVLGVYPHQVDQHRGATQGWSSLHWRDQGYKFETLTLPLEMLAARLPGGGTTLMRRLDQSGHLAHFALALRADTVGRVGQTLWGTPTVRYSMGERDLHRLRAGVHQLARLHAEAGATSVYTGIPGLPAELPVSELSRILEVPLSPRRFLCILSHLFGGATFGLQPDEHACDPEGRVRGIRQLWVACAAGIPTTLGVNPQHTIMALARVRGEAMLEPAPAAG